MSCGIGHRRGLDLVWLWLGCRPAAVAPIGSLAWELPYALGSAKKKDYEYMYIFFFFLFLGPNPRHMEVPRLGVKSEL